MDDRDPDDADFAAKLLEPLRQDTPPAPPDLHTSVLNRVRLRMLIRDAVDFAVFGFRRGLLAPLFERVAALVARRGKSDPGAEP